MIESLRYNKGLGNSAIYSRIATGTQFYDFVAMGFVAIETANCRLFMIETDDTSATQAWYSVDITPPVGGPWPVEIVELSSTLVIGNDLILGAIPTPPPPPPGTPYSRTATDIIVDAMGLIGVTEIDETPTSSEMNVGLRALNTMIDRWSSQRLMLRSTTAFSFPLVAGKAQYTIGLSGADLTANKPLKIYSAFYRQIGDVDQPIDVIDRTTYNNLADKSVGLGPPEYICYDPMAAQQGVQTGTFFVYLTPDQAYTMNLQLDTYLTEFSTIYDTVTFEPAYYEALIYNLAVRLFRRYHGVQDVIPVDIIGVANNTINNLKALNAVQIVAGMELPGRVSGWNIFVDGPNF
jgi:hypothetical protein